MSDVTVSVVESTTSVTVSGDVVDINVVESPVTVSTGTSGPQGASYNQGDPIYERVRNSTGATLLKGQIVYLSGATGNHVNVSLALASGDATSARTIGWISENIANNAEGFVMMFGYLEGIDTSAASAVGDILYLSPTVAGGWTSTKPSAPQHMVYVGVCVRKNPSNGAVSVHIQNGYELEELHNVAISSPVNNQVLTYDSTTDLWVNATNPADGVTSITATSPLTGGTITSTGSIGLDQTALSITQSQVTNLTTDLAGKANLAGGNAFTGAQTITSTAIGEFPLSIIPASGQTASTFRVRNSANNADLMSIDSSGQIRTSTILNPNSFNNSRLQMQNTGVFIDTGVTTNVPLAVRGAASQTADYLQLQNNAGTKEFGVAPGGAVSTTSFYNMINATNGIAVQGVYALRFNSTLANFGTGTVTGTKVAITNDVAGNTGLRIVGAASQTANLQEWQTSDGAIRAFVSPFGLIAHGSPAAIINNSTGGNSRVSISTVSTLDSGLTIRAVASQTADILQIQNSANSVIAKIDSVGDITARVQRSTFAARFTTTDPSIAVQVNTAAASQTGDLLQFQSSTGTVLGGRNANAQIFTGATAPITTAVGAGINGVSATGTVVTISTTNAHNLANGDRVTIAGLTPAGYNGTYIISGVGPFSFNIANTTTGVASGSGTVSVDAQASITTRSAGTPGVIVRGSASQGSNLFEVQDSTGAFRVRINQVGNTTFAGNITSQNNALFTPFSAATVPLTIQGAASQTASFIEVQNSSATTLFRVNSSGYGVLPLGLIAGGAAPIASTTNTMYATAATSIGLAIRGAASQTANLQQWQISDSTVVARVLADGQFVSSAINTSNNYSRMLEANSGGTLQLTKMTAQAGNAGAGIGRIYFRDGTTAGTLKLVVRAGAAGAETTILDNIPQ